MKTIYLLVGNSDRRLNNLVEVAVRDVCYNHALVECFRTTRLAEVVERGACEDYDLIIIAPEHLSVGPGNPRSRDAIADAGRAIGAIKKNRPEVPIIGIAVPAQHELKLLMAGADNVFGLFFDEERLKSELRRVLNLSEPPAESSERRSSWAGVLKRTMDRFTQAIGG